jgi:hypothetical protein
MRLSQKWLVYESRNLCHWSDLFFQPAFQSLFSDLQIIVGLQIDPALRVGSEKPRKPESRVGGKGSFSCNDFAYAPLGDANGFGKSILSYSEWFQEILKQNFSGMDRRHVSFHVIPPSVVIGNFDISGIAVTPFETDSPLVVYPNAPLSFSIACQLFESVGRWYPQKTKRGCGMNLSKLSKSNSLDTLRQL